jgi:uncharacterized protein (DUF2147 family)
MLYQVNVSRKVFEEFNVNKKIWMAALLGVLALPQAGFAIDAPVTGIWKMGNGKLVVKVDTCESTKICVKIANIAKAFHNDGTPRLDDHNPDPALRSRPVVGLQIISGMAPTGPNTWKGKLYNSDDGHTYTAYAKLKGDALEVQGCWGPFCKTLNFAR